MIKEYIAVLDSGIGGLSVLREMVKIMPEENYLYLGDNENAPYGNKRKTELLSLTAENLSFFSSYKLKCLVLACNTLSVNCFSEITEMINCKVFGVFPPVEKHIIKNRRVLMFSTVKTAEKYRGIKNLIPIGLKDLAEEIEKNKFSLNKVNLNEYFNLSKYDCDVLILGCTHYSLLKNTISVHKKPPIVDFGEKYTAKMVKKTLKNLCVAKNASKNKVIFIGRNARVNEKVWLGVVKNGL